MSEPVTIEFVRELRDCPYNNEAAAKGKRLLYDHHVSINGERRAIISDWASQRDRDLSTLTRKRIAKLRNRGEWERVVVEHLDEIPTLDQYKAMEAEAHAMAEAKSAKQAERDRIERLSNAAPALFASLTELLAAVEDCTDAGRSSDLAKAIRKAKEAIEKATS